MRIVNGDIYCEFADLLPYGISDSYLRNKVSDYRKGITKAYANIIHPDDARRCLIKLSSIPATTLSKIEAVYKKLHKLPGSKSINLEATLKAELEAQDQAEALEALGLYIHREEKKQVQDFAYFSKQPDTSKADAMALTKGAVCLRLLSSCHKKADVKALNLPGISTKGELEQLMLKWLQREELYGLKIKNQRYLKRRVSAFAESGLESMISSKKGKKNALKRNENANYLLLSLYTNIEKVGMLLPAQVWAEYMYQVERVKRGHLLVNDATGEVITELPEISVSTVKAFLNQPENKAITAKVRHGNKYYKDFFRPYVHGAKPKYALSMTSSDGEVTPFFIKGPKRDERGVAYLIFDVFSQVIVGWNLDWDENKTSVEKAFANMLEFTNGLRPMENQLDNAIRGDEFKDHLQQIFPYVSFAKPYNPQSKYVEPLIGAFETAQLRRHKGWLGQNITAKKANSRQRPLDREQNEKPHVYSMQELKALYAEAIAAWNHMVQDNGLTRMENYLQNINPGLERIEPHVMASLFGEAVVRKLNRGFIEIEVDGQEYQYDVPLYRENLGRLKNGFYVRVRYLRKQLEERIWIYNYTDINKPELDEYLDECRHLEYTQRAKAEQTEADGHILGRHLKRVNGFDSYTAEKAAAIPSFTAVDEEEEMTEDEAESLITQGYVGKKLLQQAERVATKPKYKPFDLTGDYDEDGLVI